MILIFIDISPRRAVHVLEIPIELRILNRIETDVQYIISLAIETCTVLPYFLICNRFPSHSYNNQKLDKKNRISFAQVRRRLYVIQHFLDFYVTSTLSLFIYITMWHGRGFLEILFSSCKIIRLTFPALLQLASSMAAQGIEHCARKDAGTFAEPSQQFFHMRHSRYFPSVFHFFFLFFLSHFLGQEKKKVPRISDMQLRALKVSGMSAEPIRQCLRISLVCSIFRHTTWKDVHRRNQVCLASPYGSFFIYDSFAAIFLSVTQHFLYTVRLVCKLRGFWTQGS